MAIDNDPNIINPLDKDQRKLCLNFGLPLERICK